MKSGAVNKLLAKLATTGFAPLDLLPGEGLVEKVVSLSLSGVPAGPSTLTGGLARLAALLEEVDTSTLKVVVFGGGTGLSNLIGGDSRHPAWAEDPFRGLKEIFPRTSAVVCVTDDGGSTGELLKDLDIIALGDLRHVLLSSIKLRRLQKRYRLSEKRCYRVAAVLHRLFNRRYDAPLPAREEMLDEWAADLKVLPARMGELLQELLRKLYSHPDARPLLRRPHCLGNLLLAVQILRPVGGETGEGQIKSDFLPALAQLAEELGADREAVLPCCLTPSRLKLLYSNGVMVTGEYKAGHARRGCPVEHAYVATCGEPEVPERVLEVIGAADLIIYAPGSLYTSIVPILQLTPIVEALRANTSALKLLVTNLWVQKGETDLVTNEGGRRFHVSDLIRAYHRNIPGGIDGLFQEVVVMGLHDIPGSILQSYALEGKVPIYFDRERVAAYRLHPLECRIFSSQALEKRRVVQHDPEAMARAIRAIWAVREQLPRTLPKMPTLPETAMVRVGGPAATPARLLAALRSRLRELTAETPMLQRLEEILWRHGDISIDHLNYLDGIVLINRPAWRRSQEWDRIFSFYDPIDRLIKIRADVFAEPERFELAFLVALGQSLLGNYVARKEMRPVADQMGELGRVYQLTLRPEPARRAFLSEDDLHAYLLLARMCRSEKNPAAYFRLVNGNEGFTPPGLLFGLVYAWYLDNRFAPHIEYKMAILRMEVPDMIPEQAKISGRRQRLVSFFRRRVFGFADIDFEPEMERGGS
jgi:uncharacterized cofD-like protein